MSKRPLSVILLNRKNVPGETDLSSFFSITLNKIQNFTDDIYVLNDSGFETVKNLEAENAGQFLDFLSEKLAGRTVMILNAYSPLLDVASTTEMLEEHINMAFDYSYSENLPEGLVPEIIESEAAGFIRKTIPEGCPLFKESVRELFESDLSSYDTNIFIRQSRLVQLRIHFQPRSWNDYLVTEMVMDKLGTELTIEDLETELRKKPGLIRQRPTYYEIQLTTEREKGSFFLAGLSKHSGEMELDKLKGLLEDIKSFSYNPVILFGFYGEPFLHSTIDEIIELTSEYPEIQFIFESRGFLNSYDKAEKALEKDNVELIVDISFSRDENYAKHKAPMNNLLPFDSLSKLEERIKGLKAKEKVYPQFTRATVNEDELMKFYEKWRDYQDRIIIKKLDTFNDKLKKYLVVDLAPVQRSFCLHLKHDVYILSDGRVALNRHDTEGERSVGNAFNGGLETCWEELGEYYLRQWESDFKDLSASCDCDDWWIFNF